MNTRLDRASALATALLLVGSSVALTACVGGWGGPGKNKGNKRPSIKRLRFYNETEEPTVPADGGKHIVVWHGTSTAEPSASASNEVGDHDAPIPKHDDALLNLDYIADQSSRSVKFRFKVNGYPLVTHWVPIPDPKRNNFIDSITLTVDEGPGSKLALVTTVRYWDARAGVYVTGAGQITHWPPDSP